MVFPFRVVFLSWVGLVLCLSRTMFDRSGPLFLGGKVGFLFGSIIQLVMVDQIGFRCSFG